MTAQLTTSALTPSPVTAPASVTFPALDRVARLVVTDPYLSMRAEQILRERLSEFEGVCGRSPDSELSRLHRRAGSPVVVSELLFQVLDVALWAAEVTGGLVDPTVNGAVIGRGHDRDVPPADHDRPTTASRPGPAPDWWRIQLDPATRQVLLPRGIVLDLSATAAALAADDACMEIAAETGCGVLVSLGGDIATAGSPPPGGWRITVAEDHAHSDPDPQIAITSSAVSTSSTTYWDWRHSGRRVHHIIDPRTGNIAAPRWRTASVAATTCLDATTAATVAMVLGRDAPGWLAQRRLSARLVGVDGRVCEVGGWPADIRNVERTTA